MTIITLAEATTMSTGYRGRGKVSRAENIPAGTEVRYKRTDLNNGEVIHEVFTMIKGERYSAARRWKRAIS